MKKIGLVIAIEREMKSFLEYGADVEEIVISNKKIYKTVIAGKEIYAAQSGYGLIDASAMTQLLISYFGCEIIMNFGVTGALIPGLKVEDLFLVHKTRSYTYDVSGIDPVKPNQYDEFPDEFIPLDEEFYQQLKAKFPALKEAVVASGDRFIEERKDKENLASLGCNICDMEIVGIARTSFLSGARCISIKCISDTFEGGAGDFNTNVISSAKKAFDVLLDVLETLEM